MPDVPNTATARALVDGALAKATALGLNVSIAVLDSAGHLVAFQRMDGAPPFTADVAQSKAYGVIFMRRTSARTVSAWVAAESSIERIAVRCV